MSFNALKYVEDLRNAGVPAQRAEAQVRILHEVVESNLATKRDLKEPEQKLIIKLGSLLIAALAAMVALSNLNLI